MTNKRKKLMTTAIAGSMAASIVIGGGTFAYLQSQTDDVVNEFKTEQVKVEISESPHDPYDIIPGTEQDKDPSVTVKNTLESFVFLKVTDNTYGLVTYEIDDTIWTKLDGYEDVYYKKVPAAADASGTTLKVLKNDKVSYDKDLINEDMLDENGDLRTDVALSFNAFAIQARPFTDPTDPADTTTAPTEAEAAAAAYNNAPVSVSDSQQLKDVLENGGSARLSSDIVLESNEYINIAAGTQSNLDLNGHTLSVTAEEQSRSYLIKNNGTLTISDSSADNSGKITSMIENPDKQDSPSYASNTISNYGTLVLNGGTIENHGKGYACYPVDCYAGSSFTMNGGSLIQNNESTYALRMFCSSTTKDVVVTINNGTISGGYGLWIQYTNGNANMGSLTINGGEINSNDGYALYAGAPGNWTRDASNISVNITGGTINGTGAWLGADTPFKSMSVTGGTFENLGIHKNAGNGFVSGGTFRNTSLLTQTRDNESPIIADGYHLVDNGDDTWSVTAE